MESNTRIELVRVVSVHDDEGGGRIRARMSFDRGVNDNDIPYAFPLLPKFFHVSPQVDESVLVLAWDNGHRVYFGPLISQLILLNKEPEISLKSMFPESGLAIRPYHPQDGVFPEQDEIGILGRKNADIQFKDREVWIRAGQYTEKPDRQKEFSLNPSFIKIMSIPGSYTAADGQERYYTTSGTIVAEEINLISSSPKASPPFKTNDPKRMISDAEMRNIIEKSHKLPYGDVLVEILGNMMTLFVNHVHNGNIAPPSLSPEMVSLIAKTREKTNNGLLSKNVGIN
jgi:hypothetical protein